MEGSTDVVVGRQGIYDAATLVGYELLFRATGSWGSGAADGDQMTAELLFGAMSIGLDHLVADGLIVCRVDRAVISGQLPLLLPPGRTVIHLADTLRVDDEVLAGCRRLSAAGYRLAVEYFGWRTGQHALLPLASIVKMDVAFADERQLRATIEECRAHGGQMLASRVNCADDIPQLAALGFDLFQGYALDRPEVVPGRTLAPADASGLLAAAELVAGEVDFDRIEQLLRRDPALAYQIMQLAAVGRMGETRRRINSIHDALVLVGARQVRNWLAVLLARPAGTGRRGHDAFVNVLLRARACELLAGPLGAAQAQLGFAAGMLSALDILLEMPIEEIAATLPLSDELRAAAFGGDTPVARLVSDAIDYETDHAQAGRRSGLPADRFHAAFGSAFTWAIQSAAAGGADAAAAG